MRTRILKKSPTQSPTAHYLSKIIALQAKLAEANFDLNAFMNLVVKEVQKLTQATGTVIELVKEQQLIYRAATGTVKKHLGLHLNLEKSFSGLSIQSNKILSCDDTEKDERVNREACRQIKARSMVVAPLLNEGKPVGVLKILSHRPHAFNESHVQTLQLTAGLIGSALAHQLYYDTTQQLLTERTKMLAVLKKAESKLHYQANHDYLTDLPNRPFFQEKLVIAMQKARREHGFLGLIYMDMDHFKTINDTLGHSIGDALLQEFSDRLKEHLKNKNIAARFGGDEFVLLIDQEKDRAAILAFAESLLKKIREPYSLLNQELIITSSMGITFFNGEDTSADTLLSQADQALYDAKRFGRNTIKIYKSETLSN